MFVLEGENNKYLNDLELVEKARSGDDAAMAELIAIAMPIAGAKAAAQQAKNERLSSEDLVQEGMLGFLNAVNTYSGYKGASFRTYADICIGNRIITAVRSHNSTGNFSLTSALPIDCTQGTTSEVADPVNAVLEYDSLDALRSFLSSGNLSDFEKSVVELRLSGLSYSEAAKKLGRSKKAVDNALARIRKKMREKL